MSFARVEAGRSSNAAVSNKAFALQQLRDSTPHFRVAELGRTDQSTASPVSFFVAENRVR